MRRTLELLRMAPLVAAVSLAGITGCGPAGFRMLSEAPQSEGAFLLQAAVAPDGSVLATFGGQGGGARATRIVDGSWVSTPAPATTSPESPVALTPTPSADVLASLWSDGLAITVDFHRWDGAAWESITAVTVDKDPVTDIPETLASAGADASGRPWVAVTEYGGGPLRFRRQGAAGFEAMPTLEGEFWTGGIEGRVLQFDGAGRAFYATRGGHFFTLENESSAWTPAPALPEEPLSAHYIIDSAGRIVVAVSDGGATSRVYRLEAGAWTQLGDPIDLGGLGGVSALAIDQQDLPYVLTYSGPALRLHRWDGAAWTQLGAPVPLGSTHFVNFTALVVPPGGRPTALWVDATSARIGPLEIPAPTHLYAAEFTGE